MDEELGALASAHGVATWYEDTERRRIAVSDDVVVAVLAELGVDAGSPAAVRAALADARAPRPGVPDSLIVRQGEGPDIGGSGEVITEDGAAVAVSGRLPADLPLGWHTLATDGREVTLVVTPPRLPAVPPAWGWQLQLYALHSAGSQGIGDLEDLRALVTGSAALGAGVVLVNPVQAITPSHPIQRSPYSPSSRRFANPLYLRVPGVEPVRQSDLIDYDAVWTTKLAALERMWTGRRPVDLPPELQDFA
ncbi:MAG TPA: 4-alpha-glucanotransferase, partial [Micromonosporaceae bacterium]|nr:4-alpha-glucanotransferase [Micromonosporaceae bacterium]